MSNALSLHDGVFLRAGLDVNCRKALYPPPPASAVRRDRA